MRTGTWPWIYSDDLPSYNMVDFYSYVNVYQRVETPVILHVFFTVENMVSGATDVMFSAAMSSR